MVAEAEPLKKFEDGKPREAWAPRTDENGELLWRVQLVALDSLYPGFEIDQWFLLLIPTGTPAADVAATLRMDRGRVARRTERMMGRLRRPAPRTAA